MKKIVYTTDNWATKQQVVANYYTNYDNNLETWGFMIRGKKSPQDEVIFC